MPRPSTPPIGLPLGSTAQAMSRAFDDALAAAGGSLPSWLVLISPKIQPVANQRALAEAVGIQGATLTHHLNAMEQSELITHRAIPRIAGCTWCSSQSRTKPRSDRMRTAAVRFDQRLRVGLTDDEVAGLSGLLRRLRDNVSEDLQHPHPDGRVRVTTPDRHAGPADASAT
jgi:MarR family transcriptional regulator for hemolysin